MTAAYAPHSASGRTARMTFVTAMHALVAAVVFAPPLLTCGPWGTDFPAPLEVYVELLPPPDRPWGEVELLAPPRLIPPPDVPLPQTIADGTVLEPPPEPTIIIEPTPDRGQVTPLPNALPSPPPSVISLHRGSPLPTAVLADANACIKPAYPTRAARDGDTGMVVLAMLVGSNGLVLQSEILRSSGTRELDRAAQAALSLCKFVPATQGGVAQPGWAQIAYLWTLD